MTRAITQADVDEIAEFCKTHPNCRIVQDEYGWGVCISDGKNFYGEVHPLAFLDIIHDEPSGESILKGQEI